MNLHFIPVSNFYVPKIFFVFTTLTFFSPHKTIRKVKCKNRSVMLIRNLPICVFCIYAPAFVAHNISSITNYLYFYVMSIRSRTEICEPMKIIEALFQQKIRTEKYIIYQKPIRYKIYRINSFINTLFYPDSISSI